MELLVVESPTKARTISSFLKGDFQVQATLGHLRDLPEKSLGVDITHNFEPKYVIIKGRRKIISLLKNLAKKAERVYLATDPDREGEAIAWHVAQMLGEKRIRRIVFHEITKEAVQEALKNPRSIDLALVDAQKARRILDRLVGYKLSPLLWKKIQRRLSAGRVQSVALRLVVEREREIEKFVPKDYFRIFVALKAKKGKPFVAELVARGKEKYGLTESFKLFCGRHKVWRTKIEKEEEVEEIIKNLVLPFRVKKIEKKEVFRNPPPPFTTSTLQQSAFQRFGWSAKKTMKIAQSLYEKGLITYHRTDSVQLAPSFIDRSRDYIKKFFGQDFLPKKPRVYKTKAKVAQEAHEAIRPTDFHQEIEGEEGKLFTLIQKRAVACQMKSAILEETSLLLSAGPFLFEAKGVRLLFEGFLRAYPLAVSQNLLPPLKEKEELDLVSCGAVKSKTKPPARYTDATLIKTLEQEGIGRPSTYAPIVSLIQQRNYVFKEKGRFRPTELGNAVCDFLVAHFPNLFDLPFTAQMEDELDKIARGEKRWIPVIEEFWQPFEKTLKKVLENAKKIKVEEEIEEKCPKCGASLVVKFGRYGKFVSCSRFPECDFKKPYIQKTGLKCPECGGEVVVRRTKKGKIFYGCANWPECKWASWQKPKPIEST